MEELIRYGYGLCFVLIAIAIVVQIKAWRHRKAKENNECSPDLIDMIMKELSTAPDSQIDNETRKEIINCKGGYPEKYDLLVKIGKMDTTQVSSFVRELCALDKYYKRPN